MKALVASTALALTLLLTGCETREPVAQIHLMNPGEPYPEIACTRDAFKHRFPTLVERMEHRSNAPPELPPLGQSVLGDGFVGNVRMDGELHGAYCHGTHQVWFICKDPAHPTEDERMEQIHERAHRIQHLQGWEAARPLWLEIAKNAPYHMTHDEIRKRLVAEHLIN